MTTSASDTLPAAAARDRNILWVGAVVYLAWWALVEAMLPGAYNPLGSRLAVVGLLGGVALASFGVRAVARHMTAWSCACVVVLTLHYHWLFLHNRDLVNWIVGEYITVLAVGATFASIVALRVYLLAVMTMALVLCALRPDLRATVFLPGLVTIIVVQEIAHRARTRLVERLTTTRLQREHAERLAADKTRFLNLVSHELITPLQAVELTVEHLRRRSADPAAAGGLERIARATKRLTGLIESLLEYARLGRDRVTPTATEFSLAEIALAATSDLRPDAEAKQLELRCDWDASLPPIRSDPRFVRIILVNLIGNAIKYTPHGSVVIRVARADDAGQKVQITDTGPGIPAEAAERIFESFVQLEPFQHKHLPGTGLGLAIVRDLADRLDAHLELSSVIDRGSTFSLRLGGAPRDA